MVDTSDTAEDTVLGEIGKEVMESNIPNDEINDIHKSKKKRVSRALPALSYEESLAIANGIWQYASGQKIRRITLFDHIGKSPESGPSRALITTSSKYGITVGGYQADYIELTQDGYIATNPDESAVRKATANYKLAIESNEYFTRLYSQYKDMKLPSKSVMIDFLREQGLSSDDCTRCVEIFIINAKYIGILKVMAGSERILTLEQITEELKAKTTEKVADTQKDIVKNIPKVVKNLNTSDIIPSISSADKWSKICFYITPIGQDDSEERNHSNLFLNSIVEPAMDEFGFTVVRADKISTPGMITSQIIEYIVNSKLVIADLSFHNPNVFYELSLRHTCNLPTIHLIRKCDKIPFDLSNFRTIVIDNTSIYTFVPQIETYRTSVAMQVRQLLESPDITENPISAFMHKAKKNIEINNKE